MDKENSMALVKPLKVYAVLGMQMRVLLVAIAKPLSFLQRRNK
jgi:hypothetical protein